MLASYGFLFKVTCIFLMGLLICITVWSIVCHYNLVLPLGLFFIVNLLVCLFSFKKWNFAFLVFLFFCVNEKLDFPEKMWSKGFFLWCALQAWTLWSCIFVLVQLRWFYSIFLLQRPVEAPAGAKQDLRSFKLILEYIKALPVSALLLLLKKTSR